MNSAATAGLPEMLKQLRLPAFASAHERTGRVAASENWDYKRYLSELASEELTNRQRKREARLIKQAHFPMSRELSDYDFTRVTVNEHPVRELACCDYLADGTCVVFYGDPGLGKTHLAIALGRNACRAGYAVRFYTAHELVHTYLEAAEARKVLNLERALSRQKLIIVDELGYLPFDRTSAEYLFQFFSLCYARSISVMLTTNLAFSQWPSVFADQTRLTGALLDRLSHRLQVVELSGESQRLHAKSKVAKLQTPGK